MNTFFVGNQQEILSLKRDQRVAMQYGETQTGKPKLDIKWNDSVIGMLKQEAVKALNSEINGDWDRIISVEIAQVIQTDTEEDKRQFNNGSETHYYVVPRIFYRK
jgi:hypothetical protein